MRCCILARFRDCLQENEYNVQNLQVMVLTAALRFYGDFSGVISYIHKYKQNNGHHQEKVVMTFFF